MTPSEQSDSAYERAKRRIADEAALTHHEVRGRTGDLVLPGTRINLDSALRQEPRFDFPVSLQVADRVNGEPRWLGFDVVDAEGCYLTEHSGRGCQQMLLTAEQVEWLMSTGLPALLNAMRDA